MVDRRLGRGLDFFLSGGRNTAPNPAAANAPGQRPGTEPPAEAPAADGSQVVTVPIGELTPGPFQPRKALDEDGLKPLAESIRASGILQPILARKDGARYQIVAGERRWRAAQLAGLTEVPVLVRPLTDEESAVFGLVENLQREDLNAIETALAYRQLIAGCNPGTGRQASWSRAIDRRELPATARSAQRGPGACFTWNTQHGPRAVSTRLA
jgi:ParB family transcriptional regulator, chromosome partitioning protein